MLETQRDPITLRESILCTIFLCRLRQVSLERLMTDYAPQHDRSEIKNEVDLLLAEGFLRGYGKSESPALTVLSAASDFLVQVGILF
mgnify:CR=1 FL=1